MTIAERRRGAPDRARTNGRGARRASVVDEIAARRRADIQRELADVTLAELERAASTAPPPRPAAEALAAPGLHLVAEVKRASPSAGEIARADDAVSRARAYAAGGAAAISVL